MAEKKQGVAAGSMNYEEGFNYVRAFEDRKVNDMLVEYMCRIETYSIQALDNALEVTIAMNFPANGDQHEIRSLAWFILKAMHPSLYKEQLLVLKVGDGWQVWAQWKLYTNIRTLAQIRQQRSS